MKEITYISSPPLLDNAIEQVKFLSEKITINFVILVSNSNSISSIFQLKNENIHPGIYSLDELQYELEFYEEFKLYLHRCKTVQILIFSDNLYENIKIFLKAFKHDLFKSKLLHFDDISGLGLIILLRFFLKKVVLNIHDPIPHSGEFSLVNILVKRIAFLVTNNFVVYSKFAQSQFISKFGKKKKLIQLNLIPYNFYTRINKDRTSIKEEKNEIIFLFFGRISPYKGINELLTTFNKISSNYPDIKLIIAGKGRVNFVAKQSSKIVLKNYFIDLQEMTSLFQQADVLVCPYKDATQSGVIMTALAFNLPHIVSNVGALPENSAFPELVYDIEDPLGLEKSILSFLQNSKDYNSKALIIRKSDVNLNVMKMIDLYHSLS